MMNLSLLAVGLFMKFIALLFVLCSIALILIVLIQKGRGGGLTAALGGGIASGILGSKTGDFLTWVTIVLVGVFLFLAVIMAKFYKPTVSIEYGADQQVQTQQTDESQQLPVTETDQMETEEPTLPQQPAAAEQDSLQVETDTVIDEEPNEPGS